MSFREILTGIADLAYGAFQGNDSGGAPVMLSLGGFKFSINTAVFTELHRSTDYRWPAQELVGQLDALQYTGPGDDTMRLPGVVYPDWRGGGGQIDQLRGMASAGVPYTLIGADGTIWGMWVITSIDEGQSFYNPDGSFRRQEFTINLKKFSDAPYV